MLKRLDTLQRVELAEGVEVRLRVAGPFLRARAFFYDLLLRGLFYFLIGLVLMTVSAWLGAQVVGGLALIVFFLGEWLYFVLYEGWRGATPGKKNCGLRVVQLSGAPILWGQAFIRNLLRFADFLPFGYGVGIGFCLATPKFQRLGDLAAGTVVVHNRPMRHQDFGLTDYAGVTPLPVPLQREEERALLSFLERLPLWSGERTEELIKPLEPLTGSVGKEGVYKVLAMANWLRKERGTG